MLYAAAVRKSDEHGCTADALGASLYRASAVITPFLNKRQMPREGRGETWFAYKLLIISEARDICMFKVFGLIGTAVLLDTWLLK